MIREPFFAPVRAARLRPPLAACRSNAPSRRAPMSGTRHRPRRHDTRGVRCPPRVRRCGQVPPRSRGPGSPLVLDTSGRDGGRGKDRGAAQVRGHAGHWMPSGQRRARRPQVRGTVMRSAVDLPLPKHRRSMRRQAGGSGNATPVRSVATVAFVTRRPPVRPWPHRHHPDVRTAAIRPAQRQSGRDREARWPVMEARSRSPNAGTGPASPFAIEDDLRAGLRLRRIAGSS